MKSVLHLACVLHMFPAAWKSRLAGLLSLKLSLTRPSILEAVSCGRNRYEGLTICLRQKCLMFTSPTLFRVDFPLCCVGIVNLNSLSWTDVQKLTLAFHMSGAIFQEQSREAVLNLCIYSTETPKITEDKQATAGEWAVIQEWGEHLISSRVHWHPAWCCRGVLCLLSSFLL